MDWRVTWHAVRCGLGFFKLAGSCVGKIYGLVRDWGEFRKLDQSWQDASPREFPIALAGGAAEREPDPDAIQRLAFWGEAPASFTRGCRISTTWMIFFSLPVGLPEK
jgi:hypothetical protein